MPLPAWPEPPLDESPQRYEGVQPILTALANWLGLALPGRGGVGDPGDVLRRLAAFLAGQERPVGRYRIPGDLPWVARYGGKHPPEVMADPTQTELLSQLGREGSYRPGEILPKLTTPARDEAAAIYEIARTLMAKPNMTWRQDLTGRFKY